MDQITADDRKQRAEDEGGVGRATKQTHPGKEVVEQAKSRRVPAEPVEQDQHHRDGEEADVARPRHAAHHAERQHGDERQRARIELAHVLRQIEAGRAPGKARRPPIIDLGVGGAVEIRKGERQQVRRMQRAASRRHQVDDRPVGGGGEQIGHQDREPGDQGGCDPCGDQRPDACDDPRERMHAGQPVRDHQAGHHVEAEQGHLIAPERDQAAGDPGRGTCSLRRAHKRPRQQPEGERQPGEAGDLAGMLQPRSRRAAEREPERRHQRAGDMPAAVAEQQDDADAAEKQRREGHGVGGAEARPRVEPGERQMQGREQHRLRVGDLRPAGERIGRPQRRLPGGERGGEELQLRLDLRLGVPWNGDGARQPRPGDHHEGEREDRNGGGEREG